MTREQAINYLISSGFSEEQVSEIVRALTYEPTTKNNLGVDCISREEVIDIVENTATEWLKGDVNFMYPSLIKKIKGLPSVTPQPREGHWISKPHVYGVTYCSECDFELKIDDTNYCPNCGAKMEKKI